MIMGDDIDYKKHQLTKKEIKRLCNNKLRRALKRLDDDDKRMRNL